MTFDHMRRTGLYYCNIFFLEFVDDFMRNSNFGIGVLHVKRKYIGVYPYFDISGVKSVSQAKV